MKNARKVSVLIFGFDFNKGEYMPDAHVFMPDVRMNRIGTHLDLLTMIATGRYGHKLVEVAVPDSADALRVAEEVFDLTNNPSREEERQERYGNAPSLSVGDVVVVHGEVLLCRSFGWAKFESKMVPVAVAA